MTHAETFEALVASGIAELTIVPSIVIRMSRKAVTQECSLISASLH